MQCKYILVYALSGRVKQYCLIISITVKRFSRKTKTFKLGVDHLVQKMYRLPTQLITAAVDLRV